MWWWKTWERTPQFFSRLFTISWYDLTPSCITRFSAGFVSFPGHLILSA
jgi:hypothetical protein